MKRLLLIPLLATTVLILHPVRCSGDWWISTIDSAYAVMIDGYGSSICLDSLEVPCIAYSRSFNTLHYAVLNPIDSTWTIEFIDSSYCPRMKLDSRGLPHIASMYKYVYRDTAGVWHVEDGKDWGYGQSLALDSQDQPHILDELLPGDKLLMHWYKDSTGWRSEVVDSLRHDIAVYSVGTCIAIDDSNVIHTAYFPGPEGTSSITYARKVDGIWHKETIDTIPAPHSDMNPSIALDTAGFPCVAWVRWKPGGPRKVKFARKDSSGWHVEVVDTTLYRMYDATLAMDNDDLPHIAYFSDRNLKYAWFDGESWNTTVIDPYVIKEASVLPDKRIFTFIEMVVDTEGYCHIAYDDQHTNTRKYARGHGFVYTEEQERSERKSESLVFYPNPFRAISNIEYQIPNRAQVTIRVYDVTGRMVKQLVNKEQKPGAYTVRWQGRASSGRRLPTGVYFVRLTAGDKTATKKLVLVR